MKLYVLINLCLLDLGVVDSYERKQGKTCDIVVVSNLTTTESEFIWWYIWWCHTESLEKGGTSWWERSIQVSNW